MEISDYLYLDYNKIKEENFPKDYLKKKFENDILKHNLDYNLIHLIVRNYFEDYIIKTKETKRDFSKDGNCFTDVLSPFLDTLIKKESFEYFIEIPISINVIKKV